MYIKVNLNIDLYIQKAQALRIESFINSTHHKFIVKRIKE